MSMPKCIREDVDKMVGESVKDKGPDKEGKKLEHYDFCVENINKNLKMNLTSAPSKVAWVISCRAKEFFDKVFKNTDTWLHFSRYQNELFIHIP